jgi:predicted TIM-barrel fold metal-dependent hydrolase
MWRMDSAWSLLKSEVPHLKRLPSEYFYDHVYLTTQPVEEPHRPEQFVELMEHFGGMANNIVFASDYPHWDSDDPDFALPNVLSDEIKQKIHYENGRNLYNL